MTRIPPLPLLRLRRALRPPGARAWGELLLALALFALVARPLAWRAGLIALPLDLPPPGLLLRVLLVPALLEEAVFRALPNPHPVERAPAVRRRTAAALSLAAYVAAHPLGALARPAARDVLLDPAFLLLTALLGALCLLLYRRSGSLWGPTLLHATVVAAWLPAGGSALLGG